MRQTVKVRQVESPRCVEINVVCPKCGDMSCTLRVATPSKLKALAQYRKLILEVHNQVEHAGNK